MMFTEEKELMAIIRKLIQISVQLDEQATELDELLAYSVKNREYSKLSALDRAWLARMLDLIHFIEPEIHDRMEEFASRID